MGTIFLLNGLIFSIYRSDSKFSNETLTNLSVLDITVKSIFMEKNIITDNVYSVEQSISGYWRLMKGEEVILDDSACEDLNVDRETAEAFFCEYLKEYNK